MSGLAAMHTALLDERETYAVEGGNGDVRHGVARLVRTSRGFARCINALRRTRKL